MESLNDMGAGSSHVYMTYRSTDVVEQAKNSVFGRRRDRPPDGLDSGFSWPGALAPGHHSSILVPACGLKR